MTRERWEQILFTHVPDEVVQDMLNAYVLELEAQNAKLRELLKDTLPFIAEEAGFCTADCFMYPACCEDTSDAVCPAVARIHERARGLGVDWRGAESAVVIHRVE